MRALRIWFGLGLVAILGAACSFREHTGTVGGPIGEGGVGGEEGSGTGGFMRPPRVDSGGVDLISTGTGQDAGDPNEDANCGVATVMLERLPPDILVVLDRSGSMEQNAVTGMNCRRTDPMCVTKWADMTAGLAEVFTATEATVNWGLKLFGSSTANGMECVVNAGVEAPTATNNATAINNRIRTTATGTATPTTQAMVRATEYMGMLTDANPKFILLATDGEPTCLNNDGMASDATAAVAAVGAAADAGFRTFVVGIATTGTTGGTTLSDMAMRGGMPRNADPPYYPVTTRADLVAALAEIGKAAGSCTLPLTAAPPQPDNVAVRAMGDIKILRDTTHTEGWDYSPDMGSIILYGTPCTNVMMGTYTEVRALFGCPGVIIM